MTIHTFLCASVFNLKTFNFYLIFQFDIDTHTQNFHFWLENLEGGDRTTDED